MNRLLLLCAACVCTLTAAARTAEEVAAASATAPAPVAAPAAGTAPSISSAPSAPENYGRSIAIREVPVWGRRPMKSIGVVRTEVDTSLLREQIALSVADVLAFNTPLFVKQYGRATLSTVSFRGTGPSHTQVTWNGMRINNPMLGMTDFSMIPSHFVDEVALLHGTSSVGETSGGLGGLVRMSTRPVTTRGAALQYVQGVGSFRTFDEFLRFDYGGGRWQVSTRIACQSSPNDFEYRNRDKKENIYDGEMNIVGQYYPVERNRSGAYRDLHLMQEFAYDAGRGDRLRLSAWYVDSDRELAMLTTDYGDDRDFENRQRERTLRAVAGWDHVRRDWKLAAHAGYVHTWLAYDYRRDRGNGTMATMNRSRNGVDTFYGQVDGEYALGGRWLFSGSVALYQHLVESVDRSILTQEGGHALIGYDKGRFELEASLSARWRPHERLGLSLVLREQLYGRQWTPPIPGLFADYLLSRRGQVVLKASVARNCRIPTLNDLYFMPGGNPRLKSERGLSCEAGVSFAVAREGRYALSGSATWYDQRVDDWILWLPTPKGFFSPVNRKVHAYGVELKADLSLSLAERCRIDLGGTFSWAPSVNRGPAVSAADRSVGRQLPYEPLYSATASGRLVWRSWGLHYQWCHYSERYTMSSNDLTLTGTLAPYFMNNLSLEKGFALRWADLSLKGTVNNLFDEEYLSVLSRPMPGIHFEFFVGIRPRWGKKR